DAARHARMPERSCHADLQEWVPGPVATAGRGRVARGFGATGRSGHHITWQCLVCIIRVRIQRLGHGSVNEPSVRGDLGVVAEEIRGRRSHDRLEGGRGRGRRCGTVTSCSFVGSVTVTGAESVPAVALGAFTCAVCGALTRAPTAAPTVNVSSS